ncbi:ABC transporter permease [Nisaea acidiphila]|uniref:ABC transporter permease n=1 Tax=Nisaea acidiphila TaxID=1862145 RepID=A0A9J7ASR7_9PROT|nr:ABC transporter permease [Nisaea acidiphila]UUX50327.1 ABC transporter permease [Nisaea acidiphila]
MLAFAVRRLTALAATLAVAALVVFMVMEVLPGDPAEVMLGLNAQPDTLAALRAQMGLDRPVPERFLVWILAFLSGDLGISYTYDVPVAELIGERMEVTLPLALMAILFSTAIALPCGVLAARFRGGFADTFIMGAAQLGVAVPNFWFAILLILLFAVTLGWTSAGGFPGFEDGILPALGALLLPAVALALPQAAILARVTRSSVVEVMGEDYIRTARAKGLSGRTVLWRHAVRNALAAPLTIMGLQFSFLLAGTVIIENVFYLPGLGRLIFQAIAQRDLIVVKDVVVLLVALVITVNFVVDLLYAWTDPRLRKAGSDV